MIHHVDSCEEDDCALCQAVQADQANCRHRFELVGYRDRRFGDSIEVHDSERGFSTMDAVLVCLRCTVEHTTGVNRQAPAPVVEKKGWR